MKFWVLYRTLLSGCASRARIVGFAGASAFQLVAAVLFSQEAIADRSYSAANFVDSFDLSLLIPLAGLVFGSAALGDPIEDGTYMYLWLRPVRRWQISVAGLAATLTLVVPLVVLPAVGAAAVIASGEVSVVVAVLGAALAAAMAYSAMFVLLGQLVQRSLIWGVVYVLILEQFIARGGSGLGMLAVHSHAVSLLGAATDRDLDLAYFPGTTAAVAVGVFTLAMVGVSARRQSRMEVA